MTTTLTRPDTTTATMKVTNPTFRVWRIEITTPDGPPVVLASAGEVAMALHLSGKTLSPRMTREQIIRATAICVRRAGVDRVGALDLALRQSRLRQGGTRATAAQLRERHTIWSDRRKNLCLDLAFSVVDAAASRGRT
jgi:hypothetical protein